SFSARFPFRHTARRAPEVTSRLRVARPDRDQRARCAIRSWRAQCALSRRIYFLRVFRAIDRWRDGVRAAVRRMREHGVAAHFFSKSCFSHSRYSS
ncbi:hypothetical protein, partial [Klebsiella pneumoniae]|uniref:hypothetical protein n=1 Tax=Klebsiella pneumoniae TaxID=573 RepID=UPI001C727BF8